MAQVFVGYDGNMNPIYAEGNAPTGGGVGGMQPYYTGLEQQYGLQPGSLAQMAFVESSGNPNAQQGSYQGLFQMGPNEQQMFGIANPWNPQQSASGAAAYAAQNLAALPQQYGPYGGFDAYMAHQQGAGGYGQLLAAGNDTYMDELSRARQRNAAAQNLAGYNPNTWTVGDFLGTFNTRYSAAPDGTLWPDYSYNQQYAPGGYPQGFSPGFNASGNAGYGSFSQFGMQPTGQGYVDNSTFNSINQMLPGFSYSPGQQMASLGGGGGGYDEGGVWRASANVPWAYPDFTVTPQPQQQQGGGYSYDPWANYSGPTMYSPAAEYGGGMTLNDTQAAGQVYDASQQYAQNFANMYQYGLDSQMQAQNAYGQNQFNQNASMPQYSLNPQNNPGPIYL